MFDELGKSGKRVGWPDLADPLTCGQKDWEGALVARDLLSNKYGIDLLIKSLRKGASPFAEIGWEEKLIGEDGYGDSESKAFLEELREALGPREGWHCRIAPLLTNEGVAALREKAALKLSTPKAKAPKKKLKNRSDIL